LGKVAASQNKLQDIAYPILKNLTSEIKVDSFLNHQMDVELFLEMAKEFKSKFASHNINKILTMLMLFLAVFSISSCSRDSDSPQAPTDETKDRGHEMPDRVEFIFKNTTTSQEQRRAALMTQDGLKFDNTAAVEWKEGDSYLLEIVYYNNGRRLNSEFVSQEMAPIHQHFFQLNKNGKPVEEAEMWCKLLLH